MDKIIDELACSHPGDSDCCAPYSLISKVWVEHAQECHFNYVNIYGMDEFEKWRRCITPDPFGVSRHTRDLCLGQISTIEGYESTSARFQWRLIPFHFFLRLPHVAFGGGVFRTDGFKPSPVNLRLANYGTNNCHLTCHAPPVGDLRHRHGGRG